ncbi:MAG: hypothetical protein GX817_05930, partial [Elusimicrobia bacterium]|nr:hypothetical protein [Elusimicrobiota bacterium]
MNQASGIKLSLDKFLTAAERKIPLKIQVGGEFIENIELLSEQVNILGLEMSGYFDEDINSQLQVLSPTGLKYVDSMPLAQRLENFGEIFRRNIGGLVLSDDLSPPKELLGLAQKRQMPVLSTPL